MRDAADDVGAQLDGLAHQLLAAVEAEDALLRERDELEVDQAAHLLAQVDQRAQRGQLGVADVDMAAHVLDAAGELPAQHLPDPGLHVLVGEVLDPLGPDRDALEQRAGHVRARLADGQHRVEVDVRLDQRGSDQPAAQVDDLARRSSAGGRGDAALVDADVGDGVLPGDAGVAKEQIDHPAIIACPRRTAERGRPPAAYSGNRTTG